MVVRLVLAALAGLLVAVYAGNLCAQPLEVPRHAFTVGAGLEYLGSRDDIGSPLRYEGMGFPLRLAYSGQAHLNHFHEFNAAFSFTGFNASHLRAAIADEQSHIAETAFVNVAYGQFFRLSSTRIGRLFLGPQLRSLVFFRSYQYEPNQIGSVEVWDAVTSLDLAARLRHRIGRHHHFDLGIGLPLLAYVLRPGYAVRGDERVRMVYHRLEVFTSGRFATWNTLQMVNTTLQYGFQFAANWRVDATHNFSLFHYSEPLTTRGMNHRLTVGVSFLF